MIAAVTLNASIDKRYVVEQFNCGAVTRVQECVYSAGGKGLNVARVAALLGAKVVATGFAGGFAGGYILSELSKCGMETAFVITEGESRSCINLYDSATGKQSELLEPGCVVSTMEQEDFLRIYQETIGHCSVVTLSGSVPKGIDTGYYPQLIRIAQEAGKQVLLDTSGNLLQEGIKAKPDFIKPNQDEIQVLFGRKLSNFQQLIDAAVEIYKSGIGHVVISLGKDGALMVCKAGIFRGKTPNIAAKNTVGCGDSMVAAFAWGFEKGLSSENCLKTALAVSAANALRQETGYFVQSDYEFLLRQVSIQRIS